MPPHFEQTPKKISNFDGCWRRRTRLARWRAGPRPLHRPAEGNQAGVVTDYLNAGSL